MLQQISDNDTRAFMRDGYVILRGVLSQVELADVQRSMDELIQRASKSDPDCFFGTGHRTGQPILRRIEYVIDKSDTMKVLLAHPFVLRSVEKLMGPDFIPTWDSMVLKMPGEGIVVPWHRDAGDCHVGDRPVFNVDFYLDAADENNCVWVIPGSQDWSGIQATEWLSARRTDGSPDEFRASGAIPAIMQPGDVLLHNILVIHGSPASETFHQRRVVYYEFRTAHVENQLGPHTPDYIPIKQSILLDCLRRRSESKYSTNETPFEYQPPSPFNGILYEPNSTPSTFRIPHEDFWLSKRIKAG